MAKETVKITENEQKTKQAFAHARDVHISARKTRLVVDLIRGKTVAAAVVQLQHLRKRAAKPVLKTLLSAIANAENNFKLNRDLLKVTTAKVDQGAAIKRWQPRAYGRASAIRRPTSHIFVEVAEVEDKKSGSGVSFPTLKKSEKTETVSKEASSAPEVAKKRSRKTGETDKGAKAKGVTVAKKVSFSRRAGDK